ncbi:putative adenylate kinase [Necator americanus]|uniref:Putative adenylate kinase n=1 Tax=Necator americanus TaxID=51031 RepID=W2SNU3_NECAM|nr:putative adenylate kinase [Necator americanus]ETN70367.1 putative adenylate kinase [Necator americanus]
MTSIFRVLISGPAGSGKRTVAKMLVREFDEFAHFSAGDFIRDHIQRGTEFGQRAAAFVRKGELVPDSILNGLLVEQVRRAGKKVILDGYPRSLTQVKMVEEVAPLNLVAELKVPKKILIDRLSKQLVHPASGRTYNLDFNPPKVEGKDDVTGEPLLRREDDVAEVVRRRIEVHDKTESKVVDYYRNHGVCITLNGESSDAVFHAVSEAMTEMMKKRASV